MLSCITASYLRCDLRQKKLLVRKVKVDIMAKVTQVIITTLRQAGHLGIFARRIGLVEVIKSASHG